MAENGTSRDAANLGPESEPGPAVRRLVRAAGQAALASALTRDGSGRPYASLVLAATDHGARPVLLLSDLADHVKNLAQDARASLLFDGTAGYADPLTGPRASLQGEVRPVEDEALAARLRRRFVARHPSAEVYADFRDFQVYRMAVESAHLVAGFGRIHWLEAQDVLFDTSGTAALDEAEADIVEHINQDHAEAVTLMAEHLAAPSGPDLGAVGAWIMTGIDPEGLDLRGGRRLARIDFEAPVRNPGEARQALIRLSQKARALAG